MPRVPIRIDRTSKPPIGTPLRSDGHWSLQGLTLAFPINESAGKSIVNTVSNRFYSSNRGVFLQNDTAVFPSDGSFNLGSIKECDTSTFTVVSGLVRENLNDSRAIISHGPAGFYLRLDAGKLAFLKSNVALIGSGNTVLPSDTYCTVALTSNPILYAFYTDGKLDGSGTHSQLFSFDNPIRIGADAADNSENFAGRMHWLLFYNLVLSLQQVAAISANPWQIYEPETVWVEVGGGGDFTGVYAAAQPAQSQSIISSLGFAGYSFQSQPIQSEIVNALLQFSGATAQVQAANSAALLAALSFAGLGLQTQGAQGQSLLSSLTFAGSAAQSQLNQSVSSAADLGFYGVSAQSQAQQAQAIYQSLVGITGSVSQTQAAQIASLSAALIFGGSSEQTQTAQIEALAAVLAFAGSTSQGQEAQAEALAALLSFGGEIDQAQAIQIEALTAILAAMDITGTVEQVQARQLQAASDFVAQVHAILRVTAFDPLALTISVRDPLALRVTVQ